MNRYLDINALFADGTADYRMPVEPKMGDTVKLRFRTAVNNVDNIYLHCLPDDMSHTNLKNWFSKERSPYEDTAPAFKIKMTLAETDGQFDYYEAEIKLETEKLLYYYEIDLDNGRCTYDRYGVHSSHRPEYDFCLTAGFSTPDWAKGAVMYQIFTDRFCNGDTTNDVVSREYYYINGPVKQITNWDKFPSDFDVACFYGGDLQGVMNKMDYLQDLGIEVIYFNPLFVSPSNHKYDIQDYDYIDPHFGVIIEEEGERIDKNASDNTNSELYKSRVSSLKNLEASNEFFCKLVEEAHKRGMKVILDGVFNHCGSFNKWLDRENIYRGREGFKTGAYHEADSEYHDYFRFEDDFNFPDNGSYEGWWGHNTLPKLNYEGSKELEKYILRVARKWVSPPFNADGWRLDVAADLGHSPEYNHYFWKRFREEVKDANPDALILAEHYGDPHEWLRGDEWDSVMNYDAFMEPVSWFLTGMEKHSEKFRMDLLGDNAHYNHTMLHNMTKLNTSELQCAMNELSNHDHSRFLTRTNHMVGRVDSLGSKAASENVNRGVFKEAVVIQMTWPGAPTVYYGDEVGLCGFTDPDNRRAYPWGFEDKSLLKFHRDMIRIHKSSKALRTGSLKILDGSRNVLAFARFNREEQFIIIINNECYSRTANLPVSLAGIPKNGKLVQIMYTTEENHSTMGITYDLQDGFLNITLPKFSAVVLKHVNSN